MVWFDPGLNPGLRTIGEDSNHWWRLYPLGQWAGFNICMNMCVCVCVCSRKSVWVLSVCSCVCLCSCFCVWEQVRPICVFVCLCACCVCVCVCVCVFVCVCVWHALKTTFPIWYTVDFTKSSCKLYISNSVSSLSHNTYTHMHTHIHVHTKIHTFVYIKSLYDFYRWP